MSNHNGDHQSHNIPPEQLTAYALGQLHGDELAAVKARLSAADSEAGGNVAQREVRALQATAAALSASRHAEPLPAPSAALRELMEQRLLETASKESAVPPVALPERRSNWRRLTSAEWVGIAGVFCACCVVVLMLLSAGGFSFRAARNIHAFIERGRLNDAVSASKQDRRDYSTTTAQLEIGSISTAPGNIAELEVVPKATAAPLSAQGNFDSLQMTVTPRIIVQEEEKVRLGTELHSEVRAANAPSNAIAANPVPQGDLPYFDPAAPPPSGMEFRVSRAPVLGRNTAPPGQRPNSIGGGYGGDAGYGGGSPDGGYGGGLSGGNPYRGSAMSGGGYPGVDPYGSQPPTPRTAAKRATSEAEVERLPTVLSVAERAEAQVELSRLRRYKAQSNTEQYAPIVENRFLTPTEQPLSTFSIDVDTAAYANARRFLTSGRLPPPDSVRIEELVNYFRYDYPQPKPGQPFSVNMEVAECPWSAGHWLLRVALKGREVERTQRPASNLVFLLDVSGSMTDANKLPLLKTAMQMLVRELGENDRVSIVTYAGEAGLKLPPTRGHEQEKILAAIESLRAGGSTNGSAGIELAYEQAAAHFLKDGTNRVILCTDGDLNVGVTSDDALVKLIKQKAAGGTFLTVLGFGEGNLKDAKMEKLADNGNGLYAYIDSVREARKVLVEQLTGSTITIAKDVKIQIEFNPREVASYRLLGYENRVLAAEDFNNDKKDAGEIGAGHTVTALYELVPVGAASEPARPQPGTDPLKYQKSEVGGQRSDPFAAPSAPSPQPPAPSLTVAASTGELLTLKLRYKEPDGDTSQLLEYPLKDRGHSFHSASPDLQFAAAVASFGMILRGSEHRGTGNLAAVEEIASATLGADSGGYRAEFIDLVRKAQSLGAR